MTRIEFDALRMRYRTVFGVFSARTARVIELSKGGERPPESELQAEEDALWELARVRRELLDALDGFGTAGRTSLKPDGPSSI